MRQAFSHTPFDGEGSYRFGGRWPRPGTRLVYTAQHLSLAMLEYLAHLDPARPPLDLASAAADIPDDVERLELTVRDLPTEWRAFPAPATLTVIGDQFVAEGRFAVMVIPSAIAVTDSNYLLNPAHPDFARIILNASQPFAYDQRHYRAR